MDEAVIFGLITLPLALAGAVVSTVLLVKDLRTRKESR